MLEVGNSRQITDIKDFLGTCRRSDVTGFTLKMVENTHEFHIQSAGDPSFLVVANDKEKADQLLQSLPPEVPRHGGFAMEEEHGDGATAAAAHEQISAVGESGRASSGAISIVLNKFLNLTHVGVSSESIKFGPSSMESDKFITVCDNKDGQVIIERNLQNDD